MRTKSSFTDFWDLDCISYYRISCMRYCSAIYEKDDIFPYGIIQLAGMTKSLRVTSLSDFYVTPNPHELLQAFPAVFFQERKKLGKTVTHQKNHFIDIIFIVDMH